MQYPFPVLCALTLAGTTLIAADAREDAADKAAFQAVCGSCHKTSMVEGLRTEAEWLEVVQQMVKLGAKGTDDQFDRVVRILLRDFTKVNVNTATASEIAPVLDITDDVAAAVVRRRTEKGMFQSLEDLKTVPGLDTARLEARRNRIFF